jgi:hypothetical protein
MEPFTTLANVLSIVANAIKVVESVLKLGIANKDKDNQNVATKHGAPKPVNIPEHR